MILTLERWCVGFIADDGTRFPTLGRLTVGGNTLYTVEDPWHRNEPGNSCVPDGVYDLVPHSSEDFPDTWAFVNADLHVVHQPGAIPAGATASWRYACLFHVGNSEADVCGCACPGLAPARVPWLGVFDSGKAMQVLRDALGIGATGHMIEIRPPRGASL